MDLVLWRHAEAEDGTPDETRRLTEKGEEQAIRVAHWLKTYLPDHTLVLASPTQRTRQTAQALTDDFHVTAELGVGADVSSLLKAANWPHGKGAVVLVGHQPTFGQAASWLLTGTAAEWPIKKGAIWWFRYRNGETVLRVAVPPDMV